jgi:YndJ-like protein
MRRNAIIGGVLWCGLLVGNLADKFAFAWIELLFLFAPLVIVPLGLELIARLEEGTTPSLPERIARSMHLPAALLCLGSFFFDTSAPAAILAAGWLTFSALLALGGLLRIFRGAWRDLDSAIPALAFVYLLVGAAWFVASRYGLEPLHFQEPIVLLTAVHFHFAGFAAPLLARSVRRALVSPKPHPALEIGYRVVATGVLLGPGLLAAAFLINPRFKLLAALLLSASEIGLAALFFLALRGVQGIAAKVLIGIAASSVIFSMVLAALWAIGEYPLQPFVGLGEMARLHGTANAFGFTLCGLLGWTFVAKPRPAKGSN